MYYGILNIDHLLGERFRFDLIEQLTEEIKKCLKLNNIIRNSYIVILYKCAETRI